MLAVKRSATADAAVEPSVGAFLYVYLICSIARWRQQTAACLISIPTNSLTEVNSVFGASRPCLQ